MILECKNLSCFYGTYQAVENVSFSINAGEYLCIVGANGSGKSTLVKTILGLNKNFTGSIIKEKKISVGYLPQQTLVQKDFPASVLEVVLSGTLSQKKFFSFYTKEDKKIALENMEKLGISNLAKSSFKELSGGQQQRVLLARALCSAKDLLILDEPVTGLDPAVTDELYELIKSLNSTEKLAILMISHDIHRAVNQASHILHMDKKALFFGTSKDYAKTEFYENLSNMEVCSTHCACGSSTDCNSSDCKASHVILSNHHHDCNHTHHH
ncbi:MAG: metal ABC transporter ATP-binding protein [Treponemataceae bacterium]|jgi:zinc transport system ATP-binding protein|nr:metal ABC transporter ATP-binding protein [Treponemataceae bacterium]